MMRLMKLMFKSRNVLMKEGKIMNKSLKIFVIGILIMTGLILLTGCGEKVNASMFLSIICGIL